MTARKRTAAKKAAPKKARAKNRTKKARVASARALKTNVSPAPGVEHYETVVGADRIAEMFQPPAPTPKRSIWDKLWTLVFGD